MKNIALLSEKGGSGKSTIAVHLAVCALRQGKAVAVIDLDPQASARNWVERRANDDLSIVSATVQELPRLLHDARAQGADIVVIDTPGRTDVTTAHVIEVADLVLIPCRPSIYDLEASRKTAESIKKASREERGFHPQCSPIPRDAGTGGAGGLTGRTAGRPGRFMIGLSISEGSGIKLYVYTGIWVERHGNPRENPTET